jgi:hypothetical protein
MPRNSPLTTDQIKEAYELRARGYIYERIAEIMGIHSSTAWNAVQRYGVDPAPARVNPARMTMTEMVDRWGSVYVEQAAGGGYIATVGDTTGEGRGSIQGAIASAAALAIWQEEMEAGIESTAVFDV